MSAPPGKAKQCRLSVDSPWWPSLGLMGESLDAGGEEGAESHGQASGLLTPDLGPRHDRQDRSPRGAQGAGSWTKARSAEARVQPAIGPHPGDTTPRTVTLPLHDPSSNGLQYGLIEVPFSTGSVWTAALTGAGPTLALDRFALRC